MMDFALSSPAEADLPRVRAGIVIGPDEYMRGRVMCFAKDGAAGVYFRLGQREAVLLRGLQTGIEFDGLAALYHDAFGRRLSVQSLRSAITAFARAGLIEGTEENAAGAARDRTIVGAAPTMFSLKLVRWDPDLFLGNILPFWRWLGHPAAFALAALLVLVIEAMVIADFGRIFAVAETVVRHDAAVRLVILIVINSFMLALHEGAHALVCKAYGGEVREMGLQIRYLTATPYTRVDDAMLFQSRWQRAGVFVSGSLVSLLALPFALVCWMTTTPGTLAHEAAADMLVWYNLLSLMQFIPFLQLDGYLVLAQALRLPNLRQDSFSYLYRRLLSLVGLKKRVLLSPDVAGYVGPVYLAYGALSFLVTGGLLTFVIARYARQLSDWIGPVAGYAIVSVLVGLLLGRFVWQMRRYNGHVSWG